VTHTSDLDSDISSNRTVMTTMIIRQSIYSETRVLTGRCHLNRGGFIISTVPLITWSLH